MKAYNSAGFRICSENIAQFIYKGYEISMSDKYDTEVVVFAWSEAQEDFVIYKDTFYTVADAMVYIDSLCTKP